MEKKLKLSGLFLSFLSFIILGCSSNKSIQIADNQNTIDVEIINLGKGINSEYNDYSLDISYDGKIAYFTSDRITNLKSKDDDDLWYSFRSESGWELAQNLGSTINTEKFYEFGGDGSPSITSDGKFLYFASSREDGFGNVDLYLAEFIDEKWSNIKNLGDKINSKSFDSHPTISPDGKILYFTSDRPGGVGGLDIWYSVKDENGNWSEPINLGKPINTEKDESSPYISADGITLYFCSNGHPGFGRYDIFVSRKDGNSWTQPQNLGQPINSEYNDRFPYIPPTGNYVYFSSDRPGGFGKYDIYVGIPNPKPPKKIISIAGTVLDSKTKKPLISTIKIKDLKNGDVFDLESNKDGKYYTILSNGPEFEITAKAIGYQNYYEKFEIISKDTSQEITKNITLSREKPDIKFNISHILSISDYVENDPSLTGFVGLVLKEIKVNESLPILNYIFFDKESSVLPSRYKLFQSVNDTVGFSESNLYGSPLIQYYNLLNVIGSRMKKYTDTKITLVGCNDNSDKENNNLELSRKRALSVQDYLVKIWGINPDRIKISYKNLPDVPSPQNTPDGQAENRRVEIQTDSWDLIKPITFGQNDLLPSPDKITFNINVESSKPIKNWQLTISQDNKVLKKYSGNKTGLTQKEWDWKSNDNLLPQSEKLIVYNGFLVTLDSDTIFTTQVEIPVKKIRLLSRDGLTTEKQYEKISLILFDFNKYDLNTQNQKVLDMIYDKITPDAYIQIIGYTDDIGSDEVNLDISKKRAKVVYENLSKIKQAKKYYYEGVGKNKPLFSNLSPEGRFYNRTVQILVERDLK